MAKPKYTIKPSDVFSACSYLLSQLSDPEYEVRKPGAAEFQRYLRKIDRDDIEHEAPMLNRWCETCLDKAQWKNLKLSIRQARITTKPVKIPITIEAHNSLLAVIDEGRAKTLSGAIQWMSNEIKSIKSDTN